jgi:lysophospholipase L1-like esterase
VTLALKLLLAPLLVAQAVGTRRRAPALPEAAGPRAGRVGGSDGAGLLRLLIAGDSSAAGVGVARQEQALAGQLGRALHARSARPVQWSLLARSGLTTRQVHELLCAQALPRADVAVVVSGVNDVIGLVPPRRALAQRAALADWLRSDAGVNHVVFMPLPPVHRFPLLPQPLRGVMGRDAMAHNRALRAWAATRSDVSCVAIDFALPPEAMASDGFHPGEPMYRACGEALAEHIVRLAVELPLTPMRSSDGRPSAVS